MTPREKGFLLLTSHLGNPQRPVLTTAQLRVLAERMRQSECTQPEREVTSADFSRLGYDREMSQRIARLLEEGQLLERYLRRGAQAGCIPLTRVSPGYPLILRQRLGLDSPGCLWGKGDLNLLRTPAISLVGSRELGQDNRVFAQQAGRQAAKQGLTLISGNARGADRAAQEACLEAGGTVISIIADELTKVEPREHVLYLSEDGFDEGFSAQRALSRNRCIHALGQIVFVAQASLRKGGTWDGTARNLRFGWSPVACFRDGSPASLELERMGAYLIDTEDLEDFSTLPEQPGVLP